ncbi:uncharacterized protein BKA78DRAFT_67031 [Phyllosticta capitalensis]|uniref:uncharacterized protein n=1 Tax=Phyllosticta capitalensis TaxID=121624 RepID=UPI00312DCA34
MSSTPNSNPFRLSLWNEYFGLRLQDDEKIFDFQDRVRRLESQLDIDFAAASSEHQVGMWLARLPTGLLEVLRARTDDLKSGLEDVPHLVDQVRRIQLEHDVNLARSYFGQRKKPDQPFKSFAKGISSVEHRLGYLNLWGHWDSNGYERQEIDKWLVRLPPALLDKLRAETNNLRDIKSAKDVVDRVEEIESRPDATPRRPAPPKSSSKRGGRGGSASQRADQRHHPYNNARRQHETHQLPPNPVPGEDAQEPPQEPSIPNDSLQQSGVSPAKHESPPPQYRFSPCPPDSETVFVKTEPTEVEFEN